MKATDAVFAGSVPQIYDTYLVPVIFQPCTDDLSGRLVRLRPSSILEIATGTGALTRTILQKLPASAHLTATDLNQPMLDLAQAHFGSDTRVIWQQADALALPFADSTYDAAVCQFGVMFFPDRIAGFRQVHRVLKPGGHFLFNCWGSIAENDFAQVTQDALDEMFTEKPITFMARVPHGYHDVKLIESDVKAAGFSSVKIETAHYVAVGKSAMDVAIGYCQGTPRRGEIEERGPDYLAKITAHVAQLLEKKYGKGEIRGKLTVRIVIAVK